MSIANALKDVRLKRTELPKERPLPKESSQAEVVEYTDGVREMDLDTWYDSLSDLTYPTVFVSLSTTEAETILSLHKTLKMSDTVTFETFSQLSSLISRLQEVLDSFPDGAFVKLSSRSFKDVTANSPETSEMLKRMVEQSDREVDADAFLQLMNLAHIQNLRCTNALQTIRLIVLSERVYEDLELALEMVSSHGWRQSVVCRQWFGNIPLRNEFRGFVWKGQLTALSQYYAVCFYPRLLEEKDRIVRKVQDFWRSVSHRVPFRNDNNAGIVDFAVTEDLSTVYILEMNPWSLGTSGALFDFKSDRDVLEGRGEFEFRMETVKRGSDEIYSLLDQHWKEQFRKIFDHQSH